MSGQVLCCNISLTGLFWQKTFHGGCPTVWEQPLIKVYVSGFVVDTNISGLSRDVSSLLSEYTIKETLFAAMMSSFQA